MNIVKIIDTLAKTPGKNDKIDFLAKFTNDIVVKTIFYYAYSPKFVYGIKKLEPVSESFDCETIDDSNISSIVAVLEGLHKREYTGNAAKAIVNNLLSQFDTESQNVIINVIKRDLRCGMDSSINKAIPDLIEPDPAYMRCSTVEGGKFEEFNKQYFYSQVKADGMYLNLHCGNGKVFAETRNGTEFPIHKFSSFYHRLTAIYAEEDESVFCGEIVMKHKGLIMPREASNGIANKITKGGDIDFDEYDLVFYAWDVIPGNKFVQKGKYDVPYAGRFYTLCNIVTNIGINNFKAIETETVRNWDEAMEHYQKMRQRGEEGTVIKCPDSPWKDGTSPYQIKMKAEVEIDLKIHSLNPGEGKNADTFGSIKCFSEDGLVEGNVSGISDEMRKHIFDNFDSDYLNTIVTVTSNNLTLAKGATVHKLFLPRVKLFRADKSVADDLKRIKEIFKSVL